MSMIRQNDHKYSSIIDIKQYEGLSSKVAPVKIITPIKFNNKTIILYPGASPYAEEHPQLELLALALSQNGFKVYIPRIPPLKDLNIKRGDRIVIYPKISSFGIAKKKFVIELLNSIIEYIGINGTIIMPSYTFEKSKKFIFNSKILVKNYSTSPLVQEFFKKKKIKRSIRPIHSHMGIGKKIDFLENKNNFNSFGIYSDFYYFKKYNFKMIFLGCSPNEAATYLINLEYIT